MKEKQQLVTINLIIISLQGLTVIVSLLVLYRIDYKYVYVPLCCMYSTTLPRN